MRALFIGGTGIISTACTRLAADSGIEMCIRDRDSTAKRVQAVLMMPVPPMKSARMGG